MLLCVDISGDGSESKEAKEARRQEERKEKQEEINRLRYVESLEKAKEREMKRQQIIIEKEQVLHLGIGYLSYH